VTKETIDAHIENSPNYVVSIEVFTPVDPTVDQIVIDLSRFNGRKALLIQSSVSLTTDSTASALGDFALESRFNQTLSNLRTFLSSKTDDPGEVTPDKNKIPLAPVSGYPIVIKPGRKSGRLIESFFPIGPISLAERLSVMGLYLQQGLGRPQFDRPDLLNAPYTLCEAGAFAQDGMSNWVFNDLGLIAPSVGTETLIVEFTSTGWEIQGDRVSYSRVNGKFSLICVTETNVTVEMKPSEHVRPINISVQPYLQRFPLIQEIFGQSETKDLHPKLIIEFPSTWDDVVTDRPVFILEAASLSDIETVNDRASGDDSEKLEDGTDDDNSDDVSDDSDDSLWVLWLLYVLCVNSSREPVRLR
jgi:hypothetical protein